MPQPPRSPAEIAREMEVLEDFVRSDGWGVFTERLLTEWQNAGFFSQMSNAMKAPDPVVEIKALHKTAINILALIEWPRQRIEYLRGLK